MPPKDIRKLYNRFKNLDKDNSGTITMEEILALPELAMNPMVSRVAALFHLTNAEEHINFTQFAKTLATFTPNGKLEDKLKGNIYWFLVQYYPYLIVILCWKILLTIIFDYFSCFQGVWYK